MTNLILARKFKYLFLLFLNFPRFFWVLFWISPFSEKDNFGVILTIETFKVIFKHCGILTFDEQNLFDRIMREKEGVNRNAVVFFIVI